MQNTAHGACDLDSRRCDSLPDATCVGERLTVDHAILNEENKSVEDGNIVACVIQDTFPDWLQAYPCKTKNAVDALKCFQKFLVQMTKPIALTRTPPRSLQKHWAKCACVAIHASRSRLQRTEMRNLRYDASRKARLQSSYRMVYLIVGGTKLYQLSACFVTFMISYHAARPRTKRVSGNRFEEQLFVLELRFIISQSVRRILTLCRNTDAR